MAEVNSAYDCLRLVVEDMTPQQKVGGKKKPRKRKMKITETSKPSSMDMMNSLLRDYSQSTAQGL